eukprot:6213967-Pleurochrysis_carterae.AAC.1
MLRAKACAVSNLLVWSRRGTFCALHDTEFGAVVHNSEALMEISRCARAMYHGAPVCQCKT